MPLAQTIADIRELKVQGAIAVAKAALIAFAEEAIELSKLGKVKADLATAKATLIATRPTEPALRNLLDRFEREVSEDLKDAWQLAPRIVSEVDEASDRIHQYGANLIENGMVVYTHCRSSTVTKAIIKAWQSGKRFTVYNTETRPKWQGRKTATELAAAGIPVNHMVDSAAGIILKKADLFLFGADAVNSYGDVFNKVGTGLFAHRATELGVKTFCITGSLKYDAQTIWGKNETIEERDPAEVWDLDFPPPEGGGGQRPEGSALITIHNPAFEEVTASDITAIVSEFGVLPPEGFVEKASSQ